jgi:hypothetical protein
METVGSPCSTLVIVCRETPPSYIVAVWSPNERSDVMTRIWWSFSPGEFPVLLAWSALAIYGCVPETDQMPTIAVMVAGLTVVELLTRTTSALPVHLLAAGIVLWSGLYGATGRGSAVVGAWFAFWPLVLVIGASLVAGPLPAPTRWALGAVGASAAVAVARTGGIEPTTTPAVVAIAIAAPVSIAASAAVVRFSSRWNLPTTHR